MQNGVPMWEAAGFLGISKEILKKTYGHHPDHMKSAALGFRSVEITGEMAEAQSLTC